MKKRDVRYEIVMEFIASGRITTLEGIFKYIPKTVVVQYMGTNTIRFTRLLNNPTLLTLGELSLLAQYFNVPVEAVLSLATTSINNNKCWPPVKFSEEVFDKHETKRRTVKPIPVKKGRRKPPKAYEFQTSNYNPTKKPG